MALSCNFCRQPASAVLLPRVSYFKCIPVVCSVLVCWDSHTQCSSVRWWGGLTSHDSIPVIPILSRWSPPILQCWTLLRTKHCGSYKLSVTLLAHTMPQCLAWPWPSCPLHKSVPSIPQMISAPQNISAPALSAIPPLLAASLWVRMSSCSVSLYPNILLFCLGFLQMRDLHIARAAPAWSFLPSHLAL